MGFRLSMCATTLRTACLVTALRWPSARTICLAVSAGSDYPETGRKALFLSTGFVKAIDGLQSSESAALLDYLNEELSGHADYQVRFRWAPNSIAVWDNRSTSHFGPVDGSHLQEQRVVHRTTVGGDLPGGPNGFVSRPLVGELFNTIS